MRRHGRIPVSYVGLIVIAAWASPQPSARAADDEEGPQTSKVHVAYIDGAIPENLFRFRFDAAYDDTTPDRAEFFYAQYHQQVFTPVASASSGSGRGGSGGGGGGSGGGGRGKPTFVNNGGGADVTEQNGQFLIYNARANGLAAAETRVDYQDFSSYLEMKVSDRLSGFIELPVRLLNPEVNDNADGLADMNAGFKWAFWYTDDQVATFQLRTYLPTGAASRGLGNNHVSLEPALLFYERLSDRLTVEGEFRDWIPVGGTDFAGNVIRYGVGVSYLAWQRENLRLTPVVEVVGWTMLSGKETEPLGDGVFQVNDVTGDTIVNLKAGARLGFSPRSDLYVGYGRAMTGSTWYKDIVRAEYRLSF